MGMTMNQAIATANALLDFRSESFDPIDFHNVGMVSEAVATLTSSKVAANRVLAHDLTIALNFYHIGRGNR